MTLLGSCSSMRENKDTARVRVPEPRNKLVRVKVLGILSRHFGVSTRIVARAASCTGSRAGTCTRCVSGQTQVRARGCAQVGTCMRVLGVFLLFCFCSFIVLGVWASDVFGAASGYFWPFSGFFRASSALGPAGCCFRLFGLPFGLGRLVPVSG